MKKVSLFLALILALTMALPVSLAEDYTLPLTTTGETLSLSIQENFYAAASYADNLIVYQELEKRTGVPIEWDVVQNYDEVMNIRFASGEKLADIVQLPGWSTNDPVKFAEAGKIIALDELIEQYAPNIKKLMEDLPELAAEMTSYDGHIYFIPQNLYGLNYHAPYSLVIRQDWLDKLELETPKTLDDWYNVLKAFKEKDPNGNGEADEIPFTSVTAGLSWTNAYGYFASGFGLTAPVTGTRYWYDENGKLYDQYQTEEFKEWISWISKLYDEGLIDPAFSRSSSDLQAMHLEDRIGATAFYADDIASWQSVCHANGHDYVQFTILETPPTPEGENATHVMRQLAGGRYSISTWCENPVLAIQWIDYHYAHPEGQVLMMFGMEGTHWYWDENGVRRWTEYVSNNAEGLSQFNVLRKYGANPAQFTNRTEEFGRMCVPDWIYAQCAPIQANLVNPIPTLPATPDEIDDMSIIDTDLATYTSETVLAFLQGNSDVEEEWDSYIATMKGIGADELLAMKQVQYDRMNGVEAE